MADRTDESRPRRRRKGAPTAAIALVVLGVVLLMQTTEILPWDVWVELWRFWPVLIIIAGINLVLGRRMPWLSVRLAVLVLGGSVGLAFVLVETDVEPTVTRFVEPVGGLTSVRAEIDFGAGELLVSSLTEGSGNLVEARFQGREAQVSVERLGDSGNLRISAGSGSFFGRFSDVEWEVFLSPSVELSLDLNGGAASMTLDLQDLEVKGLDVTTGAASVEITMPARAGHVVADISGGAASFDVVIPEGVAAEIASSSSLSSFDVDTRRFPRSGELYVSPDFDTAENRVILDFQLGVSSVVVH